MDDAARDSSARLSVGVAVFDRKGRVLLLRQAAGNSAPGRWEMPGGLVEDGELPECAARRVLQGVGLADVDIATYAGQLDYAAARDVIRQSVFTAHVDSADIILSPDHDGYTWRHADALPAVRVEVLDLVRRVAPPKPRLDVEEWQQSLPRWHVGANALVQDQDGRVLLVRPGRSRTWQLPGGQVDAHETPQDAVGRELLEETGLDLPVGPVIAITFEHPSPGWDHPTQIWLFDLGTIDSTTARISAQDPDIAEHRWAHLDEAERLLGPARTARLRAGHDGQRQGSPALVTITDPEW
ncbi:NUDIX hydrolase [Nonomuraea sp. NPDC005983]|uniref:NUDIX hydrolase n=1 Tax=Nonomuraea sp. NPDC005983 TaxID=3155595 RepID=UPI0033B34FCA